MNTDTDLAAAYTDREALRGESPPSSQAAQHPSNHTTAGISMKPVKVTKQIQASIDKVFAVFSDLEHCDRHANGDVKSQLLTQGPVGLGTRWTETRIVNDKETSETMEITQWDPPNGYVVEAKSDGCNHFSEFRFVSQGDATLVTILRGKSPPSVYGPSKKRSWDESTTDEPEPSSSGAKCTNYESREAPLSQEANAATASKAIVTPAKLWTCPLCHHDANPQSDTTCKECFSCRSSSQLNSNKPQQKDNMISFLADDPNEASSESDDDGDVSIGSVGEANDGDGEQIQMGVPPAVANSPIAFLADLEALADLEMLNESLHEDDDKMDEDGSGDGSRVAKKQKIDHDITNEEDARIDGEKKQAPSSCPQCNRLNIKSPFRCYLCTGSKGVDDDDVELSSSEPEADDREWEDDVCGAEVEKFVAPRKDSNSVAEDSWGEDISVTISPNEVEYNDDGKEGLNAKGCDQIVAQPKNEKLFEGIHDDDCYMCKFGGDLVCCDYCSKVFHLECHIPPLRAIPKGIWKCCSHAAEAELDESKENNHACNIDGDNVGGEDKGSKSPYTDDGGRKKGISDAKEQTCDDKSIQGRGDGLNADENGQIINRSNVGETYERREEDTRDNDDENSVFSRGNGKSVDENERNDTENIKKNDPIDLHGHSAGTNDDVIDEEEMSLNTNQNDQHNKGVIPWPCSKCNHLNIHSAFMCSSCHCWKMHSDEKTEHSDTQTLDNHNGVNTDDFDEVGHLTWKKPDKKTANNSDECTEGKERMTLWSCSKCSQFNSDSDFECSSCHGCKDGGIPAKTKAKYSNDDDDIAEEKLQTRNTIRRKKSSKCQELKNGKLPVKEPTEVSDVSKVEYKPLFEIGDKVYAPWWSGKKSKQRWYPCKVIKYATLKHGKYGPIRTYDVRFDDDGAELSNTEDYCIFSREDYLLSKKTDWVGVVNKMDSESDDLWARDVGWYEVKIDEETRVFPKLYDALKAYDAHMLEKKGTSAKKLLNLPDQFINKDIKSSSAPHDKVIQLSATTKIHKKNAPPSIYKGVCLEKNKYLVRYRLKGKRKNLGTYVLMSDAARAIDECSKKLGLPSVKNFSRTKDYISARKAEAKERGIELPSRSEVEAYLSTRIGMLVTEGEEGISETSSPPSVKIKSDDSLPSSAKIKSEERCDAERNEPTSKSNLRTLSAYSSIYQGVSVCKENRKFRAFIIAKKQYMLGTYVMAADAALAVDKCSVQLGLPASNFPSITDHTNARKSESRERGISLPRRSEVLAYLNLKVGCVLSAAAENVDDGDISNPRDKIDQKEAIKGSDQSDSDLRSTKKMDTSSQIISHYTSKYVGVSYSSRRKQITANIKYRNKCHYLGQFDVAADAALVHDECVRVLKETGLGYSKLNFASVAEYGDARGQELVERGIDVSHITVSSLIRDQVKMFQSLVTKHNGKKPKTKIESMSSDNAVGMHNEKSCDETQSNAVHSAKPASGVLSMPSNPILSAHPTLPVGPRSLILLNAEQTHRLRFPVGTPVWWHVEKDDHEGVYIEGTVTEASFDPTTRDLFYRVIPKLEPEPIHLSESDLAYAPSCPLFVSPCLKHSAPQPAQSMLDNGEVLLKGNVLFCKKVEKSWVYTVNIHCAAGMKLLENVASDCVFYRMNST